MIKNLTSVRGIKCWGAHSGVKSLRRDLALIYSEVPASVAAVFTQNQVIAEPVKISREHVKDGRAQAFVINAGNANACTGEQGRDGAEKMVAAAATAFGIEKTDVVIASTGIIGEPFPTEYVVGGIKENASKITNKSNAGSFAANAILTTDTFAKEAFLEFELDGYGVAIGGIAKGSGMIHPNMATMLGFIVTDVNIEPALLNKAVKETVDRTFNMITVDGDTSTNDMVAVMANGLAGNDKLTSESNPGYAVFLKKLEQVMEHLAKLIVSDGEGSSKFVQYSVVNAPSEVIARKLARNISDSTLVKAAMFGRDPNWGRVVCAAGNAGVPFNYEEVDLYLGSEDNLIQVLKKGQPAKYDRNYMKRLLRESQLYIELDLNDGSESAKAWGPDLSTDYVMFNSVYTT